MLSSLNFVWCPPPLQIYSSLIYCIRQHVFSHEPIRWQQKFSSKKLSDLMFSSTTLAIVFRIIRNLLMMRQKMSAPESSIKDLKAFIINSFFLLLSLSISPAILIHSSHSFSILHDAYPSHRTLNSIDLV